MGRLVSARTLSRRATFVVFTSLRMPLWLHRRTTATTDPCASRTLLSTVGLRSSLKTVPARWVGCVSDQQGQGGAARKPPTRTEAAALRSLPRVRGCPSVHHTISRHRQGRPSGTAASTLSTLALWFTTACRRRNGSPQLQSAKRQAITSLDCVTSGPARATRISVPSAILTRHSFASPSPPHCRCHDLSRSRQAGSANLPESGGRRGAVQGGCLRRGLARWPLTGRHPNDPRQQAPNQGCGIPDSLGRVQHGPAPRPRP